MLNQMTHKQQDKEFNKMVVVARKWFGKGYSLEIIVKGIWNKFGYCCETRENNKLLISRIYNGKDQKTFTVEIIF